MSECLCETEAPDFHRSSLAVRLSFVWLQSCPLHSVVMHAVAAALANDTDLLASIHSGNALLVRHAGSQTFDSSAS
jgi:hypothetical protein